MNFSGQPYFRFATHALLARQEDNYWYGVDAEGVEVRFADSDIDYGVAIHVNEDGSGLYAVIDETRTDGARRFVINYETETVHIENGGRSISITDFFANAVRTDRNGRAICSFMQPLYEQYSICQEKSAETSHLLDISESASKRRASETPVHRMDANLYDMVTSGMDDNMSFVELMARISAKGKPTYETMGLSEMVEGEWAEIRDFPSMMIAPIRAIFGHYMNDLIGDFPFERVSRLHMPVGTDLAMLLEEHAEIVSVDVPFEGGNMIPGYKTSDVAHFRGENFEAIVFSDMMGTYAYAWQPEPSLDNKLSAPRM